MMGGEGGVGWGMRDECRAGMDFAVIFCFGESTEGTSPMRDLVK